jgi:hypothetical protein
MPNPSLRTGKCFIRIDGLLYESESGAQLIDPMGVVREPQVGNAVYGFTEKVKAPCVKAKFSHGSGLSLAALAAVVNSTLEFRCDSGPVFILRGAWYAEGMTLTGGQGWVDVTFYAKGCREQGVTVGIVNA